MDTLTVSDLQSRMTSHPDVGLAVTIQNAIKDAIENKGLDERATLVPVELEKIRQSIFDLSKGGDTQDAGLLMLMSVFTTRGSSSGDNVGNALKYIEALQRGEDPAQNQNRYTS